MRSYRHNSSVRRQARWADGGLITWQAQHLILTEAKPNSGVDACDRADWDQYPLLAPEVALGEEDRYQPMIGGIDNNRLHAPNSPISGIYVITALYLDLARGYVVRGDCVGSAPHSLRTYASQPDAAQAAAESATHADWPAGQLFPSAVRNQHLIRLLEGLVLRQGAAQPDLFSSYVDKADRH